jgi:tripartite-type tricarboxylate transporter receptor subunit TctC
MARPRCHKNQIEGGIRMKKRIVISVLGMALVLNLFLTFSDCSWAAEKRYPSRPIEIIVGYPAGGAMDLTMRLWAKYLEKYLGVPLAPVNKPGAGAIVACTYVANAQPDGYTIGALGDHCTINVVSGRAKYTLEDFRYIAGATNICNVLGVTMDSQWKNMQEFIDYARKHPGVKCAFPGIGSSAQIRMEALNRFANLKLVGVPLNGDAEVVPAVLGKHVPVGVFGAAAFKAQMEAGKVRALMSFDPPSEMGLDPKIPDIRDVFGKDVPDVDIGSYLMVPRKTPDDIARVLEQAMEKVTKDPGFIKEVQASTMLVRFIDGKTLTEKVLPVKNGRIEAVMKETGLAAK